MAATDRKKTLKSVLWLTVGITTLVGILTLLSPEAVGSSNIGNDGDYNSFWWVMVVGALLVVGAYYLLKDRGEASEIAVWGSLGVVVGIGFASITDIWISGYSFFGAVVAEFGPAAGPDIVFVIVLVPLLYAGYQAAVVRGGR